MRKLWHEQLHVFSTHGCRKPLRQPRVIGTTLDQLYDLPPLLYELLRLQSTALVANAVVTFFGQSIGEELLGSCPRLFTSSTALKFLNAIERGDTPKSCRARLRLGQRGD